MNGTICSHVIGKRIMCQDIESIKVSTPVAANTKTVRGLQKRCTLVQTQTQGDLSNCLFECECQHSPCNSIFQISDRNGNSPEICEFNIRQHCYPY